MNESIQTTCSYCSIGCNFEAEFDEEGNLKTFLPDKNYPVNQGKSCPKGFHLLKPLAAEDRLTSPLLRPGRSHPAEPVSWSEATETFTKRFKAIMTEHGPESVAFISTGQITTEEMALLGAVAKFGMGMVHGDGNTRQCMATAAIAYKQSFGFDAPPYTYTDAEESDLLIFIGSNPVITHPVLWNRVLMNTKNPGIVVIDPRRTKTAEAATLHLPIAPKSDMSLLYAVANEIIRQGWAAEKFIARSTEGYGEFASFVSDYTPARAAEATGLGESLITDLAERIHKAKAASFWWTMGVNQSHQGVRTAQAIIDLALLTGNIGRPGTGANSITGQANAMGSRLYSNTGSLLSGRSFLNAEDRNEVAKILGIDSARIPAANSLPYHKILKGIERGEIRGLWIIGTNPGHSWISRGGFPEIFGQLDFLVVQDLYSTTETVQIADLVLPAAGSGEKSGSFINSERRLGAVNRIVSPPGEALTDFKIFKLLAGAWGCGEIFRDWSDPQAVFQILKKLSAGQPCDITGIVDHEELLLRGGIQWPWRAADALSGTPETHRRLFADGKFYTPSGRAKFIFETERPMPEEPDSEYPILLNTGRGSVVQWHTQTRTGKVDKLNRLCPADAYIELNPEDAESLGMVEGSKVTVLSRRGRVAVNLKLDAGLRMGEAFMAMHYRETNLLTYPSFDAYSFQPSYKAAAVRIEK